MTASAWMPIDPAFRLALPVLHEILDGGQAFTWDSTGTATFGGVARGHAWEVGLDPDGVVLVYSPTGGDPALLADYFMLNANFSAMTDTLPWRSDANLARSIEAWPGLRILKQDLGETLLAFLCSSTKQIVQIKEILRLLARRYGRQLSGRAYALPTWERLAGISEAELREQKMGYRARYISGVAAHIARSPGFLDEVAALPFAEARETLLRLPGVGEKIADCVLLFGAGHYESFPVDTWIANALRNWYGLKDWQLPQLRQFGAAHFGPQAGLAQQYLFAGIRRRRGMAPIP